jgi:hypothetical protein
MDSMGVQGIVEPTGDPTGGIADARQASRNATLEAHIDNEEEEER